MLKLGGNKSTSRKGSQASSVSGGIRSRDRRKAVAVAHLKMDKLGKMLVDAVRRDERELVQQLLANDDDLLAALDESQATEVLHVACACDRIQCAAILLSAGAKVNALGNSDAGPLHICARRGNVELMALLMNFGATVNMATRAERRAPLHAAVLHGQTHAAHLLVENHARPDQRDIYGYTPLHLACKRLLPDLVLWLLDCADVDVNAADNDGWTPLHLVAWSGCEGLTRLLLDRYAYCDCQTQFGKTPLHMAALGGHVAVTQLLLDSRASADVQDVHGKMAWEYTTNPAVAQLLAGVRTASSNSDTTVGISSRLLEFISISQRLKPPVRVLDLLNNCTDEEADQCTNGKDQYLTVPSITVSTPVIEGDDSSISDVKQKHHLPVDIYMENGVATMHHVTGTLKTAVCKLKDWSQALKSTPGVTSELPENMQTLLDAMQRDMSQLQRDCEEELSRHCIKATTTSEAKQEVAGEKELHLSARLRDAFLLSFALNIGRQSSGWLMLLENLPSMSTMTFDTTVARAKRLHDDNMCRTLAVLPTITQCVEKEGKPLIKACLDLTRRTPAIPAECGLNIVADFLETVTGTEHPLAIDTDVLQVLAQQLREDGRKLAEQLRLKDKQTSPLLKMDAGAEERRRRKLENSRHVTDDKKAEGDERRVRSQNLEILSAWMSQMVAMPKTTAILQLVNGVIDIGREDLLDCIINRPRPPRPTQGKLTPLK